MTIGNITSRYNEVPLPNAATAETLAICHSLKYITNVLGYQIIDINYPTLAALVSAVNQHNAVMNGFEYCISNFRANAEQRRQLCLVLHSDFTEAAAYIPNSGTLCIAMDRLAIAATKYYDNLQTLFTQFEKDKVHIHVIHHYYICSELFSCIQ